MHYIFGHINKILSHEVLVHVYSSPTFLVEVSTALLMCLVHVLLIAEVNRVLAEVNVRPFRLRPRVQDIDSSRSIYKQKVLRNHPELGVDVIFRGGAILGERLDTMGKINKILSTSVSEYIRKDLGKIKNRIKVEEDEEIRPKAKSSVEKVYEYLMKEPEMQKRLQREMQEKARRNAEELPRVKEVGRIEVLRLE